MRAQWTISNSIQHIRTEVNCVISLMEGQYGTIKKDCSHCSGLLPFSVQLSEHTVGLKVHFFIFFILSVLYRNCYNVHQQND